MKLTDNEHLLLKIIAQDADYERLDLALTEFKKEMPIIHGGDAFEIARETLQALVDKGLVALFRRKVGENSEYEPLAPEYYRSRLERKENWLLREGADEEIAAAPTHLGEKIYLTVIPGS